jgi:hypothetical protein
MKKPPRWEDGRVVYTNKGIVKDYNAFHDEYKILMTQLANPLGCAYVWVKPEDVDFVPTPKSDSEFNKWVMAA